ncbi:toll/interleukin-1 receptor domain-containing protein [Methanobrevibacter sp.]
MAHNVYICYDEKDLEMAKDVCETLEDNGLECWLKNRDKGVKDIVNEIMDAIAKTKVMVLLYSKNSKNSNFVNNEVNRAVSQKKSILVFQIDDAELEGSLEFFLRNVPWIKAHPNPADKYDELVKDTKELVKSNSGLIPFVKEHKTPVIIGVVVLILIVAVLGFMMTNGDSGGTNATPLEVGDVKVKITDFHVDDVRKEDTSWNYSYFVGGTISPTPDEGSDCIILVDFYDKTGKLVETTETPFEDAQKVSSGFLLGSTVSDTNDIKLADVQIVNSENVIIAQDDSQIK